MPQAQRSVRQIIAIRRAIAAAPTPAPVRVEDTYTILTPIKTWKSSRSRKRVVKRVQNPISFQYGFIMPSVSDIVMLLDHDAYARVTTVPARNAPVLADGDLYVSDTTGEIFAVGRSPRDQGGRAVMIATGIVRERVDIAMRPFASDLAQSRSLAGAQAQQDANVIRGRFPR
jgi:hypothetical protein